MFFTVLLFTFNRRKSGLELLEDDHEDDHGGFDFLNPPELNVSPPSSDDGSPSKYMVVYPQDNLHLNTGYWLEYAAKYSESPYGDYEDPRYLELIQDPNQKILLDEMKNNQAFKNRNFDASGSNFVDSVYVEPYELDRRAAGYPSGPDCIISNQDFLECKVQEENSALSSPHENLYNYDSENEPYCLLRNRYKIFENVDYNDF